jgi:hypothetical protein
MSEVSSLARVGVGAGDEHVGHVQHVGRQARRHQRADELAGGHQHLAAQVAALLLAGELVLEVHAGGAGLDHRLHQLEGVERAAEAGLGVGHDGARTSACLAPPSAVLDLVGALQRVVDALDHGRHRVGG